MSVKELCLREFDRIIEAETKEVRRNLEREIARVQPFFGEETGEFLDFTKGSNQCTRLEGFSI